MDDAQMLAKVKVALGITGDYLDATLQQQINTVVNYLVRGGIKKSKIDVGIVARGVSDTWDYVGGSGKFSPMFENMATQLSYEK